MLTHRKWFLLLCRFLAFSQFTPRSLRRWGANKFFEAMGVGRTL